MGRKQSLRSKNAKMKAYYRKNKSEISAKKKNYYDSKLKDTKKNKSLVSNWTKEAINTQNRGKC